MTLAKMCPAERENAPPGFFAPPKDRSSRGPKGKKFRLFA